MPNVYTREHVRVIAMQCAKSGCEFSTWLYC